MNTNGSILTNLSERTLNRPPWLSCALGSVLIFTIVVDILGNLLVIVSVYRNKKLRNAVLYFISLDRTGITLTSPRTDWLTKIGKGTGGNLNQDGSEEIKHNIKAAGISGNVFVVSLAVADLVVAVYPYPLVLMSIYNDGWNLGFVHCQISGFLMGLSVIGSIFNITGIAINRYCYICHSLKYDKLYNKKNSLCYIILIWILTVLAIFPNFFVGSLQYDARVYSCTFEQSASSAYTIAVVFFHFILPILVVTYCYMRIWILVIQVRRRVKPEFRTKLTPNTVRNFVTMFVVFVLFAICWAPLNFIGLAVAVDPGRVAPLIPEWLFIFSYFLAYFNSCLNAIVYGLLNQNFRQEYKNIIVSFCTARLFYPDITNDTVDRIRSKPSALMSNNNQVKVDSV